MSKRSLSIATFDNSIYVRTSKGDGPGDEGQHAVQHCCVALESASPPVTCCSWAVPSLRLVPRPHSKTGHIKSANQTRDPLHQIKRHKRRVESLPTPISVYTESYKKRSVGSHSTALSQQQNSFSETARVDKICRGNECGGSCVILYSPQYSSVSTFVVPSIL